MFYVINGQPPQNADALQGAPFVRFVQRSTPDGSRFLARDHLLFPNWSAAFQIYDARGLDAIYDKHYLAFVRAFLHPASGELELSFDGTESIDFGRALTRRFLTMSSIRYLATSSSLPQGLPEGPATYPFRVAFGESGLSVVEFAHPLPRISIYQHVLVVADDEAALSAITAPSFDPMTEAVAEADQADSNLRALEEAAPQTVLAGKITTDRSQVVETVFDTPAKSIAVLNDTDYPGWEACVDGRPAQILRANYLFRGVLVGPGRHILTFTYRPAVFASARALSLSSLALTSFLLLLTLFRSLLSNRRHRPQGGAL